MFLCAEQWKHACELINHVNPEKFFPETTGRMTTDDPDMSWTDLAQAAMLEQEELLPDSGMLPEPDAFDTTEI